MNKKIFISVSFLYFRQNHKMMTAKIKLSVGEQIDRARDGRSQTSIVEKMKDAGIEISEVSFSRKKLGREIFSPEELKALSEILGTEITL